MSVFRVMRCLVSGHDWDGCVCGRCGGKRDEGHDWDGCRCTRCGTANEESGAHVLDMASGSIGEPMRRCIRCGARIRTNACSNCGGDGLDPLSVSYQSGQGSTGNSMCPCCGGSGREWP